MIWANDIDWIHSTDQLPPRGQRVLAFYKAETGQDAEVHFFDLVSRVGPDRWKRQGTDVIVSQPVAWALVTPPDEAQHDATSPYNCP